MPRKRNKHLTRESYFYFAEHRLDDLKNGGYNYKDKLYKNTLSSYIYEDPRKERILPFFEKLIYFLTEQVKMIKKSINYAVDKNFKNFN